MNNELFQAYKKRLEYLQLRQAKQGINTPVEILIEIDEIQEKIRNLPDVDSDTTNTDTSVNGPFLPRGIVEKYLNYIINSDKDDINERWSHRYIALSGVTRKEIQTKYQIIDRKLGPKKEQTLEVESLEKCFEFHERFVLVGTSGAGKTTTLKRLRLLLAEKALRDVNARIPLLINLAGWTNPNQDITSYIVGQRDFQGLSSLHYGGIVLLLDGLNEMPLLYYEERVKSLDKWLRFNSDASVIIACREQVYSQKVQLSIPTIKIYPLDNERIKKFLSVNLGWEKGEKLWGLLNDQSQDTPSPRALIHLARNPYFLDMISYIFEIKSGHLPNCRGQLFQIFVETLFERERLNGATNEVTLEMLIHKLGKLAYAMQSRKASTKMPLSWAIKKIAVSNSEQDLWDVGLHASILHMSKAKTETFVGFAHQLILEYFAAESLKFRIPELYQIVNAPQYKDNTRVTGKWDEIIYTFVGIANADVVVKILADVDPILSMNSLKYISSDDDVSLETKRYLVERIVGLFESRNKDMRYASIATLVEHYEMSEPVLISILQGNSSRVVQSSILEIFDKKRPENEHVIQILKLLANKTGQIRRKAEALLEQLMPEDIFTEEGMDNLDAELSVYSYVPGELVKHDRLLADDKYPFLSLNVHVDEESKVVITQEIRNRFELEMRTVQRVVKSVESPTIFHLALFLTYHFASKTQRIIRAKEFYAWGRSEEIRKVRSYTRLYIDLGTIRSTIFDENGKILDLLDYSKLMQIIQQYNTKSEFSKRARKFAVIALGDLGDVAATEALILLLRDPSKRVVMAAAQALGKLKARDAVLPLSRLLYKTHLSAEIPIAACIALANIMDERASAAINYTCEHSSERVKDVASIALLKLKGKI